MDNFIYGAGGHGKVVRDTVEAYAITVMAKIRHKNPGLQHKINIIYADEDEEIENAITPGEISYGAQVVMGIGDNLIREKCVEKLKKTGKNLIFSSVTHPYAYVAKSVRLGEGTVVFVKAAVQPGSDLGKFCIINTGALVDHDCEIADYVHIAPGVNLCGNVRVGERTLIGVGSCVRPEITIGSDTIVGAGSVVVSNVPSGVVAYGNPCRVIKEIE